MLFKTTLTVAILISVVFACGFTLELVGHPVRQFDDVVDLVRTITLGAWIAWVVALVGEQLNAANEAREEQRQDENRRREAVELAQAIRRRENPGAA